MKRERTHYERSYKIMAVELTKAKGSIAAIAEELGIKANLIRRWTKERRQKGTVSFSGNGVVSLTEEQKDIPRLRKELKETQIERGILNKVVSIFSRSDGKFSNS